MLSQVQASLTAFSILAIELSVLFIGISLLVAALQRHLTPAKIEVLLSSNRNSSYFLGAALGAITPFCSCSTIPMLKGLIKAKAGFGPMMVFLFASPLLNPIIVVLLIATFGVSLTLIYVTAAFLVSLNAGWLLNSLGFERFIRQQEKVQTSCCSTNSCSNEAVVAPKGKYSGIWQESWADFIAVLPYLLAGTAVGSIIYGFMPTDFLENYAGQTNPFAIPIAAVIGVPLYIRAEAIIPVAAALMTKGVGAGTVIALIIGSAGASLTELILLRSLFKTKLLLAFLVVIFTMAILAGYATFLFY